MLHFTILSHAASNIHPIYKFCYFSESLTCSTVTSGEPENYQGGKFILMCYFLCKSKVAPESISPYISSSTSAVNSSSKTNSFLLKVLSMFQRPRLHNLFIIAMFRNPSSLGQGSVKMHLAGHFEFYFLSLFLVTLHCSEIMK